MKVFASIYIGSYQIVMKVFEISRDKGATEIDCQRINSEMLHDVKRTGAVGLDTLNQVCRILNDMKHTFEMYKADDYMACVGAHITLAKNQHVVLEQIRLRTGLKVNVITNSEHRFLSYMAVASMPDFESYIEESCVLVDIGGARLQLTLFKDGKIVTTQQILLGSISVEDNLSRLDILNDGEDSVKEILTKELQVFTLMFLKDVRPRHLIILGSNVSAGYEGENKVFMSKKHGDILDHAIVETINPYEVFRPGIGVCDGMAYKYGYDVKWLRPTHDFNSDIISAAWSIADRYYSYRPHLKALETISCLIFDATKKYHNMGRRQRLLMSCIAILHDCGKYISIADSSDCSYAIIMSSEILGLTHKEREMIATTVAFNRNPLQSYEELSDRFTEEEYMVILKLLAILKVANALDRSHKQKVKNVNMTVRGQELIITIESNVSYTLEKSMFKEKADFFEAVFTIRPVLKEKRLEG